MASINKRSDGVWRARYRDETGREHSRHFARKVDAQAWIDEVTASVVTGDYVDPKAGRITFDAYFDNWSARQVWVRGTLEAMTLAAKSVNFGHLPINAVRRSHIETWIKKMNADGLAPSTIKTRYNNVRTTFRAAKSDKVIGADPTEGITLPRQRRAEAAMKIPTPEEVGKLWRLRTCRSSRSLRCARSPDCGRARPPPSSSTTSISSGASSPCPDRCSGSPELRRGQGVSFAHQSMGPSASSSCPRVW
jgi:hypothetical protein